MMLNHVLIIVGLRRASFRRSLEFLFEIRLISRRRAR